MASTHPYPDRRPAADRLGLWGSAITVPGILLSSPLTLLLIDRVHPQPMWQSARLFAENYHVIQILPFFAGLFLVGGYAVTMVAVHQGAEERHRSRTLAGVVFATTFATLIFFNYVLQTTFLPALARDYDPLYDPVIGALSMANPASLGWAIEMWGYGFLGVATWFGAVAFRGNGVERITAVLLILNGVMSIAGAVMTAIDSQWVLTAPGILSYVLWNVLIFAISILLVIVFRKRLRGRTTG